MQGGVFCVEPTTFSEELVVLVPYICQLFVEILDFILESFSTKGKGDLVALGLVGEQEENDNCQDKASACSQTKRKQVDLIKGRW